MRHVLNTLRPQLLVQLRVQTHVFGAHRLLRKVHDGFDRPRGTFLKGPPVHALVQVDSVLARHDIREGGALARLIVDTRVVELVVGRRSAKRGDM